jgi:hypothetical protein
MRQLCRMRMSQKRFRISSTGQSELLVHRAPHLEVPKGEVLAHPSATVQFDQRTVPLGVAIQRFGAAKPKDQNLFDTTAIQARPVGAPTPKELPKEDVQGEFAPAQYFELSLEQKLSAASFDKRQSGIRANAAKLIAFGDQLPRVFTYEDGLRDPKAAISRFTTRYVSGIDSALAIATLGGSALGRSALLRERANLQTPPDGIEFAAPGFKVIDAFTLQPVEGLATASTRIEADQLLDRTVFAQPAMAGRLAVVSELEVA